MYYLIGIGIGLGIVVASIVLAVCIDGTEPKIVRSPGPIQTFGKDEQ